MSIKSVFTALSMTTSTMILAIAEVFAESGRPAFSVSSPPKDAAALKKWLNHSHKKRKGRLETRTEPVVFSL